MTRFASPIAVAAGFFIAFSGPLEAAPIVKRLTPPSNLFTNASAQPVVARFLPGQRFDFQATLVPDAGETFTQVRFKVDGMNVAGPVTQTPATAAGLPAGTMVATRRAYSSLGVGIHSFQVVATQSGGLTATAEGNFQVVGLKNSHGAPAKNVIILIGDGMGIAHRTAARIMSKGVSQGKINARLAMDTFPVTGLVVTHSLNSIVTDSSPGAACYSSGNKANNNQQGVFPDDTTDRFDNPRVELISEYLKRTRHAALGIVTTSDVFDATPGAFGSHTQDRGAGTGIVDQYLDDRNITGLKVLMGGGRKWFLPSTTPGSARTTGTDYVLPADLVSAWGAKAGALDPTRDLLADFQTAGFHYASNATELASTPAGASKLLGLFALSNMNVAHDKIGKRRGASTVVDDYGFPDQPMLEEMTAKALAVLSKSPSGFVAMIEGASIDKQAHNMDTERFILDTIEFDRAIKVARDFAAARQDTLVIVTADHECGGINIIGGSMATHAALADRADNGDGATSLRTGVVGTYDAAGFPKYTTALDGYPETTDIDYRMLIGYAGNADRNEDWITDPQPIRDSQQPFNNEPPLNSYPSNPLARDVAGAFMITGHVTGTSAVHTASDIPLSAFGPGAASFTGVMDNTDVFFKAMQVLLKGPF